jgi:hypothetical protein
MKQAVLEYLPGYFYDGYRVQSTGIAIPPTQHIDRSTGELMYYVRPLFDGCHTIGLFVRHKGIIASLQRKGEVKPRQSGLPQEP